MTASPAPKQAAQAAEGARNSVDPVDLARFTRLGDEWWAPNGPMRPLHRMNPPRVAWIRDHLCARYGRDAKMPRPLDGLAILDVGCGGGILCEPLARLGASVTGIDPGEENVGAARAHAQRMGLSIDYRATTVEALGDGPELFDAVLAMEVVEHVVDPEAFLAATAKLAKPGGLVFASTLNRNLKSWAMAIVGAEYLLRWLPRGTHDWGKFLTPDELSAMLRAAGLEIEDRAGVIYDPLADRFRLSARDLDVNYMLVARKEA
jgi:2-polyprenyl-6-hydroxyphenyl methylase/3-demethylubiquinone-9 3-methyltransferase